MKIFKTILTLSLSACLFASCERRSPQLETNHGDSSTYGGAILSALVRKPPIGLDKETVFKRFTEDTVLKPYTAQGLPLETTGPDTEYPGLITYSNVGNTRVYPIWVMTFLRDTCVCFSLIDSVSDERDVLASVRFVSSINGLYVVEHVDSSDRTDLYEWRNLKFVFQIRHDKRTNVYALNVADTIRYWPVMRFFGVIP